MSVYDANMLAAAGLILLMGVFVLTFLKEAIIPIVILLLAIFIIWGEDVCSRSDRLAYYQNWFDKGGEMVCKDKHNYPLSVSQENGWKRQGKYLFKENRGLELIEDDCEIEGLKEPHCISIVMQMMIGSILMIVGFVWLGYALMRLKKKNTSESEQKNPDHETNNDTGR